VRARPAPRGPQMVEDRAGVGGGAGLAPTHHPDAASPPVDPFRPRREPPAESVIYVGHASPYNLTMFQALPRTRRVAASR